MTIREADLLSTSAELASGLAPAFAPVEIDSFLALVEKPQRYIGGERNARRKPLTRRPWSSGRSASPRSTRSG